MLAPRHGVAGRMPSALKGTVTLQDNRTSDHNYGDQLFWRSSNPNCCVEIESHRMEGVARPRDQEHHTYRPRVKIHEGTPSQSSVCAGMYYTWSCRALLGRASPFLAEMSQRGNDWSCLALDRVELNRSRWIGPKNATHDIALYWAVSPPFCVAP